MGIVYKDYQPDLDRHVALKILAPDLGSDPVFAERFSREARTLGKLSHPNIVAIHDFGETAGHFWLLMEYVEGVNLHQAMQAERFTPDQALAVIPEICAALGFAHSRGVLHRDIKPENILRRHRRHHRRPRGTATARHRRPGSCPDRFHHWAIGLFLGGAAIATVGTFTSPTLLGLGLAAAALGLTPDALRVAIHRLRQLVRAEIESTTDSPAEAEAEFCHLLEILTNHQKPSPHPASQTM